jgi:S1-C subfamily serine protease
LNGQRAVSVGSVNELPSENRDKIIMTDNETRSGNSGGPLMDENSRVYGIVFGAQTSGGFTTHSFISPSTNIVSMMKKNNLLPQE